MIDDEIGITESLKDIFKEMGFEVCIANKGHEAIDIVQQKGFDIALIDIKIP